MAEDAKVIAFSGHVEVRVTREGKWTYASKDMEVPEGGGIRTGADGSAVALMPNKTKVWIKESTDFEIEQRQTLISRLALAYGKIKLRVPHLMRKERFEVRTPAAVCAVRGTEFTLETTEDGKMDINVLFGEVKLNYVIPPAKGASELYIPQGQSMKLEEKGKAGQVAMMDPKQEKAALENWNPGLKPEERRTEQKQKENDREQVKEFARVTTKSEEAVKTFLNVVKESDLEAGRTLSDVHGNVVRVDQRMVRPEANEIQFFNLVKRPSYNNTNGSSRGFAYNGAQGISNRLDYMQMTMAFNRNLPQRIEEWPGFFNDNSIKPSWASFVLANRTDADEIFFISQGSKYEDARDQLVGNPSVIGIATAQNSASDRDIIVTGVLKTDTGVGGTGITAVDGLNRITNLRVVDTGVGDGTLKYADNNLVNGTGAGTGGNVVWAIKTDKGSGYSFPSGDRPDNAPLAQYQADMYLVGNNPNNPNNTNHPEDNYLWFAKESYVISNGGRTRTPSDFTNSSSDPFTLLKDNALEGVMYIKRSNVANPAGITSSDLAKQAISNTDYFAYKGGGTNIDVVFIPDLMVAAVQRMLPAITNLDN